MATRTERAFRVETAVHLPRRRKSAEFDLYSVTGLRGQGLVAAVRTLVKQSRDRHRLGPRVPRV